jgi:hypothetical protein
MAEQNVSNARVSESDAANGANGQHEPLNLKISGDGRVGKIKTLLGGIGQLFASKTVEAMDEITLRDSIDTIGAVFVKLQRELEERVENNREVNIGALSKLGATEANTENLSAIFRRDKDREKKIEVGTGIVQFFRENDRKFFTMDEALVVIHELKLEARLGKISDHSLRIVLGDVFGRNCMNLNVTQDSNKVRTYWVPGV